MRGTRVLRAVPQNVWSATALFGVLLVCWSLVAPLGRSPDEPAHADLALLMASGAPYPEYDARGLGGGPLAAAFAYTPGFPDPAGEVRLTPESAPERARRPTLDEWGGLEPSAFFNQQPQHAPFYYVSLGTALRGERWLTGSDGSAPLDREWHLLRLMNVLIVLPLPLLAWWAARRLGASARTAWTASLVPLCIPQVTHIGSSINNDNLLLLFSAIAAALTAGVIRGDARRSTAVGLGVAVGLAVFAKGFGLMLLPWIAAAYVAAAWRRRSPWKLALVNVVLVGVPAAAIGGAWPVRNLIRHGGLFPNAADGAYYRRRVPGLQVDNIAYVRDYTSNMVQSFWGSFGWLEIPLPPVLTIGVTALAGIAIASAVSLRTMPAEHEPGRSENQVARVDRWIFASLIPILLAVYVVSDFDRFRLSGRHAFMQGRYLFPALVPLALIVGWGAVRLIGRWAPAALLAVAGVLHAQGLWSSIDRWWAEPDAPFKRSMAALFRWSPWPEPVAWTIIAALVATATWVLVNVVRTVRAPAGDQGWSAS